MSTAEASARDRPVDALREPRAERPRPCAAEIRPEASAARPVEDPPNQPLDPALSHAFFAIASHELRTPLQALGLNVCMVRRRLASGEEVPRAWLEGRLERTQSLVDQMTRLVEGLLHASEVTAGRLAIRRERFDLSELAREVVGRAEERLAWARCSCTLELPDGLCVVADRLRVELVIENLLGNAIKYAPGALVSVRGWREPGAVCLEVADGGPGIAPEDQARIFERFERALQHGTVAGFGLGLWISRAVMRAHGGSLTLRSAPGQGAAFTIRLPD